ncbi:MAG: hypothetical protein K5842_05645 [Bacteroidales bacterium]|nr:hypothetical protein [Bacteroidales bacterium]
MAGNTINVQGSYIDIHDNENVYLSVDKAVVKMGQAAKQVRQEQSGGADTRSSEEQPKVPKVAAVPIESFADRVKAIMRKAATKNGQTIKSNARGHERVYMFNVDAEAFCKAMDEMLAIYGDKLKELLGGTLETVQVTKVCFFIGNVVRMHIINDTRLQTKDLLFAFEDYYDNLQTVQTKLGDKGITDDQEVVLGTFQGLLKKHIS